jgi:hypothetical protein
VPSPQTAPATCNTSYFNSSFGGPDAIYTFTLPAAYEVSADLCTGTTWDTVLGIFNSAHALVAVNDDGCSLQSQIAPCCLDPGVYFLVVDGYGSASGAYTLNVHFGATPCEIGDPCADPVILTCGSTATGNTADGMNYVGNPAPDLFYQVNITQSGPVTFSLCDAATDYDSYIRLFDDCPTEGGVQIAGDDDSCNTPGLASTMTIALDPGTYWLVVEGFSSGSGNFALSVECSTCDPITCVGQDEGEPNEGPNADPVNFGSIDCGVTVCGTTWASGGTRDTDWFELLLLDDSYLHVTSEAEMFDALVFVLDENYNILYMGNNNNFCEGEAIDTQCLNAGTYYVWMGHAGFDGVPDEVNYSLSLECETCVIADPCVDPIIITCGDTVTGTTTDGFNYVGNPAPDKFYEMQIPDMYDVTISLCDGGTNYDSWIRVFDGCPTEGGVELASNDDSCGLQSELTVTLAAGTYWLVVEGYASASGNYSVNVSCGDSPCEGLPPVNCVGTQEVEPNEGWNDDNASYNEITCAETVCGSVWATGGTRDLDWYHFTWTGGDLQIDTQIEEFDCILFLTDFEVGGNIIASADNEGMCVPETLGFAGLPAGEYYFVIAHNSFDGVPEDQDYALTFTCLGDPCDGHIPVECTGTAETEPNEGWNADPPNDTYNEITNGETVCGSVWADGGTRDLDWYHFIVTETTNVNLVAEHDEFNCILFLTDFDSAGGIYTAADANGPCQGEAIHYECLAPGEYYAVIAHNDFEGVPDDQNYSLTMTFSACSPVDPCADMVTGQWSNGYYTVNRGAPIANHHNAINGCDGISSAGYDELHLLTLNAQANIRVTMNCSVPADKVTYVLSDCNFTESCLGGVDVGGTDTVAETFDVTLPAGTYYFVADFWGSAETHPYTLQVRNLTTDVDGPAAPLTFAMTQNVPNPFNPTTSITWTQPELMPATLAVYNLAGQKVQEMDLGFRGPGVHSYTWDASQLSSGVYFYSLTTGGQTLTKKAVLLK